MIFFTAILSGQFLMRAIFFLLGIRCFFVFKRFAINFRMPFRPLEAMITPGTIHSITPDQSPAIAVNITFSALNAPDKVD